MAIAQSAKRPNQPVSHAKCGTMTASPHIDPDAAFWFLL